MSSLETGRVHGGHLAGGCRYRARIKPRQACCRRSAAARHRNEAGGIYDDEPAVFPAAESRHQA